MILMTPIQIGVKICGINKILIYQVQFKRHSIDERSVSANHSTHPSVNSKCTIKRLNQQVLILTTVANQVSFAELDSVILFVQPTTPISGAHTD